MNFQSRQDDAGPRPGAGRPGGPAGRPRDGLRDARPTAARSIGHTTILTVKDSDGKDVDPAYAPPAGKQVVSPQAAFIVTDILAGNTNPNVNPFWGKFAIDGPDGRRPATLKTGTNNDAKDLNAYGYIAPPTEAGRDAGAYALAVGVWNGNSRQQPGLDGRAPLFSIDVSTFVWQGFLQEASAKWPIDQLQAPADGLVQVEIDPLTGLCSTTGREIVDEWFIAGTEPKDTLAADTCGIDVVARGQRRERLRQLDEGRPGLAPPRRDVARAWSVARTGPGRRTSTTARSTRTAARGAPSSAAAAAGQPEPGADVLSRADPGSERRHPVVRGPDAGSGRAGRRRPLPAGDPAPSPSVEPTLDVRPPSRAAEPTAAADRRRRPSRRRRRHRRPRRRRPPAPPAPPPPAA